jgi:hypothetical protein
VLVVVLEAVLASSIFEDENEDDDEHSVNENQVSYNRTRL